MNNSDDTNELLQDTSVINSQYRHLNIDAFSFSNGVCLTKKSHVFKMFEEI